MDKDEGEVSVDVEGKVARSVSVGISSHRQLDSSGGVAEGSDMDRARVDIGGEVGTRSEVRAQMTTKDLGDRAFRETESSGVVGDDDLG